MFTGIVEELGEVAALDLRDTSAAMSLRGPLVTGGAAPGDSIAVNGVCLTVVGVADDTFDVDVMRQTLQLSGLGDLAVGDRVNLERAMAASGRFGGHVVQGHVDATTTIRDRSPGEGWEVVTLALPPHCGRYVVAQGSITLDGVSLTVAGLDRDSFTVSLIPTTLARTTLGHKPVGARVNVEVDVIAKYVERLLSPALSQGATA